MYQGGSSKKKGPRLAMREQDDEPPREADVRPCEWPSEEFMIKAGIKENLMHMCVMSILRTSCKISVISTTI